MIIQELSCSSFGTLSLIHAISRLSTKCKLHIYQTIFFSDQKNDGSAVFRGLINKIEVRRVTFQKDMKNKVRRFYNDFYDFVDAFIKQYEVKHGTDAQYIDKELREYRKTYENLKK